MDFRLFTGYEYKNIHMSSQLFILENLNGCIIPLRKTQEKIIRTRIRLTTIIPAKKTNNPFINIILISSSI